MKLTDFLLARIDEDESQARQSIAERIRVTRDGEEPDWRFTYWPDLGAPAVVVGGERVLAECDAKRRLVELHAPTDDNFETFVCTECEQYGSGNKPYPCPTMRLIASPYADHPDYDVAWRA